MKSSTTGKWECFNPSSIGIGFRSKNIFCLALVCHWVSILLLLELAFEVSVQTKYSWLPYCFNPSSIGIGFRSSILYMVWKFECLFQSFFYWNWLSKRTAPKPPPSKVTRFNPSSIGIGFRRGIRLSRRSFVVGFQSFFYWNWLSKPRWKTYTRFSRGVSILLLLELAFEALSVFNVHHFFRSFNPSSIGIGFRSSRWRAQP